jgi:Protein DA1
LSPPKLLAKNQAMQRCAKFLLIFLALLCLGFGGSLAARAQDVCAICGKPIQGPVYIMTDEVTGEKKLVCSDCIKLPRCSICGLPVKENFTELPDGRYLCERDAKTVVLKADDAERICAGVKDDLDKLFSRFTSFPDNVDVTAIDRIDVDAMFHRAGNNFESPDLLGCIQAVEVNGARRYKMSLMTGMPTAELKETCAHEFCHAWVGENVNRAQRGLGRDAEEGFCEMVGYLLMDSQSEEGEKKRVLANHYTRGQVELFIEAEQRYGFDQILDWMKYGVAEELEPGHLEEIRDVKMPAPKSVTVNPAAYNYFNHTNSPPPAPAILKLQGILWGNPPVAIINGHSFSVNEADKVKLGKTEVNIRCVQIQKDSVRIQNVDSGTELELRLPAQ